MRRLVVVAAGLAWLAACSSPADLPESANVARAASALAEPGEGDPLAGVAAANAGLRQALLDAGLKEADIDALEARHRAGVAIVQQRLDEVGATPSVMTAVSEGHPFYEYLRTHRFNDSYSVLDVGKVKLVYKAVYSGGGGDIASSAPGVWSYVLMPATSTQPEFPGTFSDAAAVQTFTTQEAMLNLVLVEMAIKVGPWFFLPVVGQFGAIYAVAAAGALTFVDAATGESLAGLGDDLSFTVLAAGKAAPGQLKLAAHAYLLVRAGHALIQLGIAAPVLWRLIVANTELPVSEDDLAREDDPDALENVCDVTVAANAKVCREESSRWGKSCCPEGQVATGACTIFEQRCVLRGPRVVVAVDMQHVALE